MPSIKTKANLVKVVGMYYDVDKNDPFEDKEFMVTFSNTGFHAFPAKPK